MFAGGMAIGVPSFMPGAASDLSVTEGLLTVSTTTLQGVAILEIIVNDPDVSDTTTDIPAISADVGGTSYDLTQAVNGKWYAYVVDSSQSQLFDADAGNGFEFGVFCDDGLGIAASTTDLIVGTGVDIWANAIETFKDTSVVAGGCLDIDNAWVTTDDGVDTSSRQLLTDAVLQNAPSLSNHDDTALGASGIDMGQRGMGLNESGHGAWPYIIAIDFTDDNIVEYGGDSISVTYGNTDDETSIELANRNPGDRTEIHLTVTDPALNIDPTTADIWVYNLSDTGFDADSAIFANNGSNTALDAEEMGQAGFVSNGQLRSDVEGTLAAGAGTVDLLTMTETGANTGVFESFDTNGNGQIETSPEAAADTRTVFSYGGNSVDMIITYNDAEITFDAGGDWAPRPSRNCNSK